MTNKTAIELISENKIQAQRDLESALILLASPNPHLENVAFLLEQSFEKIIKTSYARYMVEAKSASWHDVYDTISNHNIDFILDMLDEFYKSCVKTITQLPKTWLDDDDKLRNVFPKEIEKALRSPENLSGPIKRIQNLKKEVEWTRRNFVEFMSGLDSKSLTYLDFEPPIVSQFLTTIKNLTESATDAVLIQQIFKDYIIFLAHLSIAPYALSHVHHSRYPVETSYMSNLKAYRNNSNLKGFFDTLADHVQKMLDSEAGFTERLIITHSVSSDISRHANKT